MVLRRSRLASAIRQSGSLNSGAIIPSIAMASFTGIGLVSMNIARQSGKRRWNRSRARFQSPSSAAWVISAVSRGPMLATTQTTPRRPGDDLQDALVLVVGEGGGLPRGPAGNNGVGAVGDVELHELAELRLIYLAVAIRRGPRNHRPLTRRF